MGIILRIRYKRHVEIGLGHLTYTHVITSAWHFVSAQVGRRVRNRRPVQRDVFARTWSDTLNGAWADEDPIAKTTSEFITAVRMDVTKLEH